MIMANPDMLPPGFRFHPTDEELILHYLRNRAANAPCPVSIIADVDIYKFDPWDLPSRAAYGDKEWYFFSPRDRKYPNGIRPNRAAGSGYWKATGTDKPIHSSATGESVGVKKALVFYKGRPPKGSKTNWIMHEYRLAEALHAVNTYRPMRFKNSSMRLDDWVLCRIYKKTAPQLYSSPSHEPSSMDDLGQQQLDNNDDTAVSADDDLVATYAQRLPRPASISDYLVDYPAVSELFATLPPPAPLETTTTTTQLELGTDASCRFYDFNNNSEASTSAVAHQQSSHKRGSMEDYSHNMLNTSNKRVMMMVNDHASSMAVNNNTSVFEPPGQTSLHHERI